MMYITSCFAAAIIISYHYSPCFALVATGVIGLFLFYVKAIFRDHKTILLLLTAMITGIMSFTLNENQQSMFDGCEDEAVHADFVISNVEYKESVGFDGNPQEYIQLTCKTEDSHGEKLLINYYEGTFDDTLIPGKQISVSGTINLPSGKRNPGCFDYALYVRSIGIKYIIAAEKIDIMNNNDGYDAGIWHRAKGTVSTMHGVLYNVKEQFIKELAIHAGNSVAGLIRAIMFGDTSEVSEDILDDFRKNGTAHVLAVSGLHIGIIYGFICALWRWKKGKLFFLLTVVFFLMYMVMASFSPSVIRAVVMIWLHIFAQLTNRKYDMASAAFFTALIMLIINPMHIFNVGFQMSFLAVLTLSLMLPIIKRFYSGIFMASIAVQAGLTPYIIYVFNYFSIASVVVNVPIIFLIGIIVPLGMCSMVFISLCYPLGALTGKVLGGLCIILEKINSLTCIEGLTVFDVKSPDLWIVSAYYLVLLVFVSEDGRLMIMRNIANKNNDTNKRTAVSIKWAILLVLSATLLFSLAAGNRFKDSDIVFVDVGQGDCMHISVDERGLGRNKNYLIDGGGSINYEVGKKTLKPYLLKNGVKKIDGAFVTHLHTDHYKGIAELCREGMIEKLYVFEGYRVRENEIIEDTGIDIKNIIYLHVGQKVILGGNNDYIDILWPDISSYEEYEKMAEDEGDENSFSLIMKVTLKDKSLLATGDVDSTCLDALAARYGEALDADILKVAHHGSKYSESEPFTVAAEPEYAVFQVGKNNFGHPAQGVVENFRQKGIMVYRNDEDGAIAFDIRRNGGIRVRTVIRGE